MNWKKGFQQVPATGRRPFIYSNHKICNLPCISPFDYSHKCHVILVFWRKKANAICKSKKSGPQSCIHMTFVDREWAPPYLASAMWVNDELLGKVRAWKGGETVWKSSQNKLGYAPKGAAGRCRDWTVESILAEGVVLPLEVIFLYLFWCLLVILLSSIYVVRELVWSIFLGPAVSCCRIIWRV